MLSLNSHRSLSCCREHRDAWPTQGCARPRSFHGDSSVVEDAHNEESFHVSPRLAATLDEAAPTTAVSDIPEECVLVGPRNARIFIFSDRILTIPRAMYLVSNKVASNEAKITVFLPISYNYLRTCYPSSPNFELLKKKLPGRLKKCQIPAKTF